VQDSESSPIKDQRSIYHCTTQPTSTTHIQQSGRGSELRSPLQSAWDSRMEVV